MLQLGLSMENGSMNSSCLSDKPVYQKVNLVENTIYPLLALGVGGLIWTVRIYFLNSELLSVFFLCTHLLNLTVPSPTKGVLSLYWQGDSHTILHLQITFLSLKFRYLTYANMQSKNLREIFFIKCNSLNWNTGFGIKCFYPAVPKWKSGFQKIIIPLVLFLLWFWHVIST